jgi:AcrR family transcriptional regulator
MPKRKPAYMEEQRELIARATLECLLEKGLYETSLRDICQRAGISIGALYIHFKTKEEAVIAACALDNEYQPNKVTRTTWASYVESYQEDRAALADKRAIRRYRLSLQIAADLALSRRNPVGLTAIYSRHMAWIRASLQHMQAAGEITLPLGLEATANTHSRLMIGTIYMILSNKDIDPQGAWGDMLAALALTAGYAVPKANGKKQPNKVRPC